jgi:hypothetical protein
MALAHQVYNLIVLFILFLLVTLVPFEQWVPSRIICSHLDNSIALFAYIRNALWRLLTFLLELIISLPAWIYWFTLLLIEFIFDDENIWLDWLF